MNHHNIWHEWRSVSTLLQRILGPPAWSNRNARETRHSLSISSNYLVSLQWNLPCQRENHRNRTPNPGKCGRTGTQRWPRRAVSPQSHPEGDIASPGSVSRAVQRSGCTVGRIYSNAHVRGGLTQMLMCAEGWQDISPRLRHRCGEQVRVEHGR
jgi:hypothetical protein